MNYARINQIWPKLGGVLAIVIILSLIIWWVMDPGLYIFTWLFWLHLALLMLHEFEEYVYPGGFKEFINTDTVLALETPAENFPANDLMITFINLGAWFLIALAAVLTTVAPWLGIMMVIFNFLNIVGHGGIFQVKMKGYNPGLFTTIFIFVPYSVIVLWLAIDQELVTAVEYVVALIGGVFLALSLPLWANIRNRKYKKISL
ncbi:MAG: HXXEE domain-containing protein [Candidatus Odinarchaeota archaeon]